ncbi:MAG: IS3 family transposase [Actinomycetales bacterium]
MRPADISLNEDTEGSVILWVTPAGTTLPRSMPEVSQSFWGRMQTELFNTRKWRTVEQLSVAIADYIGNFHNTRRRQSTLGRLTPIEFEAIMTTQATQAA